MKFKIASAAVLVGLLLLPAALPALSADKAKEKQTWEEYSRQQLDQGYIMFRSAQTAEDKGNKKDARALYEKAFDCYSKVADKGAPDALRCMISLGDSYMHDNQFTEAEASYRKGLSVASKLFGAGSDQLVPILTKIGNACMKGRKYKDAATYLKQAYDLTVHKSGEDSPASAELREALANAYERDNQFSAAEPLLTKAIAARDKQGDTGSPQLLMLLDCYSDLLRQSDRNAEADQVDYRIDVIHNKSIGQNPAPAKAPDQAAAAKEKQ